MAQDINFAVRTRQRRSNQEFQNPLDTTRINPNLPFKFIAHGWIDWGNNSWIQNLSYAFLERGDYNVIAVNWHNLAQQAYSVAATRSTRQVGKFFWFIKKLSSKNHRFISYTFYFG